MPHKPSELMELSNMCEVQMVYGTHNVVSVKVVQRPEFNQHSDRGSLGCNAVQCCRRIPTFRRPCCFHLQGENGGRKVLPQHHTAPQRRGPALESSLP